MAFDIEREGRDERPAQPALWRNPRVRAIAYQLLLTVAVVAFAAYIVNNTLDNLQRRGITTGFGFLDAVAGFDIGFVLVSYTAMSTYGWAFVIGVINTLFVAAIGVALATILGLVIGIARLSSNWLIAKLATVYIEIARNVPVLLQILFWYFAVLGTLPAPRDSIMLGESVFLNIGGLSVPEPIFEDGFGLVVAALVLAVLAAIGLAHWARRRREATGQTFHTINVSLALIVGLPGLAFLLAGSPLSWNYPELGRFRLTGGLHLVPEFVALLVALTIYTASYIAEIVRAGILSVSHGQVEAAQALGLKPNTILRLVIIPQALRVIIPPLTSQYLNLTKNSSLAVAIGYPDLFSIGSTILNQTGQAIEAIAMIMAVYVTISLAISAVMNWYNRRMALVER